MDHFIPLMAAGGGPAPLVLEIALCFVSAGVLAIVCQRLSLPSIAGFILAGLIIGPVGLGLVEDRANIETIANLGLVFLLFLIGLEIDFRALAASGRTLIATGLAQVPLSIAVGAALFTALAALMPSVIPKPYGGLYLGLAVAFSSTLLVVKVLHDTAQGDTLDGRLSIGLLVFQDIWAIIVLAVQPNLADPRVGPIIETFSGVAIVVLCAVLLARYALPPAFRLVAKSPELMVTLALGWCFGLGVFGSKLGYGFHAVGIDFDPTVSMELGALVAGASIASFPYTHEVVAKVSNLRDFFITLFFVALGMSIPVPEGPSVIIAAVLLAFTALLIRVVVFFPLLKVSGLNSRHAATTSTKLAQVSEFALVMAYLGLSLGHIDARLVSVVIFAFVITAVATPFLFSIADPIGRRVAALAERLSGKPADAEDGKDESGDGPRIVLLGFHRLASSILHDLQRNHVEMLTQTLVVDFNVGLHDRIRATGANVIYGDIANPDTLAHAGLEHASVIVSTIPDELLKGIDNRELTRLLRKLAPDARIFMQATDLTHAKEMYAAGADHVFAWRAETARGLVGVLQAALNGELESHLAVRRSEGGLDLRERTELIP